MTHLFRRFFSYLRDRKEFQSWKSSNQEQLIHCQRMQAAGVQVEHKLGVGFSVHCFPWLQQEQLWTLISLLEFAVNKSLRQNPLKWFQFPGSRLSKS